MDGFDPKTSFGHETSLRYVADEARGDEQETVDFLARLARKQDALEFAIGAGRIALPLIHAGVAGRRDRAISAHDRAAAHKPGGDRVHVVNGDMAEVDLGRRYVLVYLVYNTIGNLLTQDEQVHCFENAARHLTDDGVFVLECRVPSAPARPGLRFVDVERLAADQVTLQAGRYDPLSQVLDQVHLSMSADGVRLGPISLRLAYPPEFDLMARIAGLQLRHRWGGWGGEPFTAASWRHVSVYEVASRPLGRRGVA